MTSASHHFANVSCSTVLPVPKPPGIAACPPRATGNNVSRMRCPVIIGASAAGGLRREKPESIECPPPHREFCKASRLQVERLQSRCSQPCRRCGEAEGI